MTTRPNVRAILLAGALVAFGACDAREVTETPRAAAPAEQEKESPARQAPPKHAAARTKPRRVDPRKGGFEIVLGEWAVTPEAEAIRPGEVTFVVHNRGTMDHGYEMELEGGDSSGPGSGDLFEAESELVRPGESTRMTETLTPGVYEIECLVDGHDDMGMEGVLEVRPDAPLAAVREPKRPGLIDIRDFGFDRNIATVPAGTEVVWRNEDPVDHTVTSTDGLFGSDTLGEGATFTHRFSKPGVYDYRCAIHPEMKGKVRVE